MASKYSAARPKRAGEVFARQHHGEREGGDNDSDDGLATKKVKFDVRNPSALAPDAREEDDILDADVIGVGTAATKRGAVNVDGYDSDSENETFNDRAEQRNKKGGKAGKNGDGIDLIDQLENYDKRLKAEANGEDADGGDDEDDDMFAENDDEDNELGEKTQKGGQGAKTSKKKWKEVRFLNDDQIKGQEEKSKSGGHIRLDEESSSDDEDAEQAIKEEAIDEEVGAGGLKKHAPKIDAFNMREEQEEGGFDEAGNFIRKAADPDAVHDNWLEGVSKRDMKRAAAAHEKREAELKQQRDTDDGIATADLLAALLSRLESSETPLEALARLGRGINKAKVKKIPKWKLKKQGGSKATDQMDVDKEKALKDPEQVKQKEDIDAVTEAADRLLNREYADIYDTEKERLMREFRNETGKEWVAPAPPGKDQNDADEANANKLWEYRWIDGRDGGAIQGPFDKATMKAWQDAGYFGEGIEFRPVGQDGSWSQAVSFV